MAKTGQKKSKKEYIFLIIFIIIMIAIGFVIIKYLVLSEAKTGDIEPVIKPTYLNQPIPEIEPITEVINNPKFKEMVYMESFFKPIVVGDQGRPNPFAPFGRAKEVEEGEEGDNIEGVETEEELSNEDIEDNENNNEEAEESDDF